MPEAFLSWYDGAMPKLSPVFILFFIFLCTACAPQPSPTPGLVPATIFQTPTPSHVAIPFTISPSPTATKRPPTQTPFPQPAGCKLPVEDYSLTTINGMQINQRTLSMLQQADALYEGKIDLTGDSITQGSYTQEVEASFGTHAGGGAVDISVMEPGTWTVLWEDLPSLISALRQAGFAAWVRDLDELYPGSPIHIHAVGIGDRDLSPAAMEQIVGAYGYFNGYDGLTEEYGGPKLDREGGPVLCKWMADLRLGLNATPSDLATPEDTPTPRLAP